LTFRAGPYESAARGTIEFINIPKIIPQTMIYDPMMPKVIADRHTPLPLGSPRRSITQSIPQDRAISPTLSSPRKRISLVNQEPTKNTTPISNRPASACITLQHTQARDILEQLRALDAEEAAEAAELARKRREFDMQEEELRRVLEKLTPLLELA
jgi:hypothetical protein